MKIFVDHPIKWGLATFFLLLFLLRPIVQPTTCRDGWHSPSIGRQGACSWHGGVGTNWSAIFAFGLSAVGGLGVGGYLHSIAERRRYAELERQRKLREAEEKAEIEALRARAKAEGVACPLCGCAMIVRRAKRGRNRNNLFRGCSRYPNCNGTRDVSKEEQEVLERPPSEEDGWERIE